MNYRIVQTDDGSPTLEVTGDNGVAEKMHHGKGAFSETCYVYGDALEILFKNVQSPKILNIGLGLGYNELLVAALSVKHLRPVRLLASFEKEEVFVQNFLLFMAANGRAEPSLEKAYREALQQTAAWCDCPAEKIVEQLRSWHATSVWQIFGIWTPSTPAPAPFHGLLYDPFSAKMNPEFWTESALDSFFKQWCDGHCVFSSYAARGSLSRRLRANGFSVEKRIGFGGKKECTLATRGVARSD